MFCETETSLKCDKFGHISPRGVNEKSLSQRTETKTFLNPGTYYVQNDKILTESTSLLQNHLSFRHLDKK